MRLFVDVTHSQNSGHPCSSPVLRCFERVVISKTLSRASRVDAKLISSNPSLLDMKDEVLYCLQRSWLGAVAQWVTILSSPWWVGVENNTQRYLYYDFFTILSMSKNTQ